MYGTVSLPMSTAGTSILPSDMVLICANTGNMINKFKSNMLIVIFINHDEACSVSGLNFRLN